MIQAYRWRRSIRKGDTNEVLVLGEQGVTRGIVDSTKGHISNVFLVWEQNGTRCSEVRLDSNKGKCRNWSRFVIE